MRKKTFKKTNKKEKSEKIYVENCSNQSFNIRLKAAPENDPLLGELSVQIKKRESVLLPTDRLDMDQINNLKRKRFLRVRPYKDDQ